MTFLHSIVLIELHCAAQKQSYIVQVQPVPNAASLCRVNVNKDHFHFRCPGLHTVVIKVANDIPYSNNVLI